MAYAGRILIMPKGDYDSTVSYERLDLVRHNGQCWLAKRNVSNVEPSADAPDDWFLMLEGIGEEGGDAYSLTSQNGEYSATMQDDGNLVVYNNSDGSVEFSANDTAKNADLADYLPKENVEAKILKTQPSGITNASSMQDWIDTHGWNGAIFSVNSISTPLAPRNYSNITLFDINPQYAWGFAKSQLDDTVSIGGVNGSGKWNGWKDLYHTGNITSGTTELTAGTSALPKGHFYAQYE